MLYFLTYEYDEGNDTGGAGYEGIYADAFTALEVAIADFRDNYRAFMDMGGWYRVDVFAVSESNDEESAFEMWENEELPDQGDVLFLSTCMFE